ncbi:hypothetical protein D555_3136 [Bordetella holmesii 35009]|nr:hypothetical protein D555_3136 [Bordetella holmesii 35009]
MSVIGLVLCAAPFLFPTHGRYRRVLTPAGSSGSTIPA